MIRLCFIFILSTTVYAQGIKPFTSDGCSLFPDGDMNNRTLWCECCFLHDIAYWMGGTKSEKLQADQALKACVLKKTGNKVLAEVMFRGVQIGGHPVFPTGYRWAYGWPYLRGFKDVTRAEGKLIKTQLRLSNPDVKKYCR